MFGEANLTAEVPRNKSHVKRVFMSSNRGMTYRLGHNPNHNETFAKMGVKPEFMFGCAFRALFRPTETLIRRVESYYSVCSPPSSITLTPSLSSPPSPLCAVLTLCRC
jgi:hypothetical protein